MEYEIYIYTIKIEIYVFINVYNCTCTPFSIDDAIPINFRIIHKNLRASGDFAIKYINDTDIDVIDN